MLARVGDPNLVQLPGGATLVYVGRNLGASGFGIALAKAALSPVTGIPAGRK